MHEHTTEIPRMFPITVFVFENVLIKGTFVNVSGVSDIFLHPLFSTPIYIILVIYWVTPESREVVQKSK